MRPFISSCIFITSVLIVRYLFSKPFWSKAYFWNKDAGVAILQTHHYTWFPISSTLIASLRSVYNLFYVMSKHIFPESRILNSELLRCLKAESKVEDYQLMLFAIAGMRSDEHVAGMRVAVHEPWYEYLLCKGADELVHNFLFVKLVFSHLILVSDLEPVDPFGHHYPFSSVLVIYFRHIQLGSF